MNISLMPYIPYDPIIGGIEDIVHRHGDLHCTEISPEMPRDDRERLKHELTDLSTQRGELLHRKLTKICWAMDLIE